MAINQFLLRRPDGEGCEQYERFPISTKLEENLSDLLDTHQDRPTEVRRRDQVKIITTPWTETQTLRAARVTVEAGVKRFHFRASRTCSHQQGWRFCGSFKEFRKGTSTLK
ncbi:Nucleic acid-binding OB-fold [Penicillium coprophilum]|uniref:Nucleic acid-binding OB-fold n=1 Tax=Penicillium coprophilum TaxID=36646 RepID=UPI00239092A7|nr:Nucleic acid-binding OB-fold [Penicillium coprophilum]KAJ5178665.1 Nucleic acid-binding OB-fold [Penicillium coprophilum]